MAGACSQSYDNQRPGWKPCLGGRGQAGEEKERGASRDWLTLRLLSRLELCCVVASVVRMGNERLGALTTALAFLLPVSGRVANSSEELKGTVTKTPHLSILDLFKTKTKQNQPKNPNPKNKTKQNPKTNKKIKPELTGQKTPAEGDSWLKKTHRKMYPTDWNKMKGMHGYLQALLPPCSLGI